MNETRPLGVPYAKAGVDEQGYYVTCPRCGEKCRGEGRPGDETKAANAVYAEHYQREHEPKKNDQPPKVEEIRQLTYDEAVAMLPDGDDIHTFVQAGPALLGCDWDRQAILDLLENTKGRAHSGPAATRMRHGLVALDEKGESVFIETREEPEEVNPGATPLQR